MDLTCPSNDLSNTEDNGQAKSNLNLSYAAAVSPATSSDSDDVSDMVSSYPKKTGIEVEQRPQLNTVVSKDSLVLNRDQEEAVSDECKEMDTLENSGSISVVKMDGESSGSQNSDVSIKSDKMELEEGSSLARDTTEGSNSKSVIVSNMNGIIRSISLDSKSTDNPVGDMELRDKQDQGCSKDINRIATSHSVKDNMIEMLDEIDNQVLKLRDAVVKLEKDRENIFVTLETLSNSDMCSSLTEDDRLEVLRYIERLGRRATSIRLQIVVQRSESQTESLSKVNQMIDHLILDMKVDLIQSQAQCMIYINSCSEEPEYESLGIAVNLNFEAAVLGCTGEDQKRIKKRLLGLYQYINSFIPDAEEGDIANN